MNARRRSSSNERTAYAREVIAALEKTRLDREKLLVLGGGALALAGIRRANDVDLMVPHSQYVPLSRYLRLPSGLILQHKPGAHHPFLETTPARLPPGMMAVDITHPHDERHHRGSPALDAEFLRTIASFDEVEGYRFLPPELVAEHKKANAGVNSRKNRKDLRLIRQHLDNQ